MIFNTKYEDIIIYAKTVEQEAVSQILEMANSPLGENAHIRPYSDRKRAKNRLAEDEDRLW